MKIIQLEIVNFKGIVAFYKKLNGENLTVAGPPGAGKTTVITSLWNIIEKVGEPLNKGEDVKKGYIKVILNSGEDKIIAKREFTGKTDTPIVLNGEGDKIPMEEFKRWYSKLGINPQDLLEQKPKELLKTLLSATEQPEGLDIQSIEKQLSEAESERTTLYRIYEREKKSLSDEPEKVKPADTEKLLEEMEELKKEHEAFRAEKEKLNSIRSEGQDIENRVEHTESRIAEIKLEMKEAEEFLEKQKAKKQEKLEEYNKQKKLVDEYVLPDLDEIKAKIQEADNINRKALQYEEWAKKEQQFKQAMKEYNDANEKIGALKEQLRKAVDSSKFPLPELSINDGKIYYDGILVDNLGTSKKSLISAALAAEIIDKEDKLRVVRMDGVESMDSEDFTRMQEIFNNKNIQVLASRVLRKNSEADEGELVISSGEEVKE